MPWGSKRMKKGFLILFLLLAFAPSAVAGGFDSSNNSGLTQVVRLFQGPAVGPINYQDLRSGNLNNFCNVKIQNLSNIRNYNLGERGIRTSPVETAAIILWDEVKKPLQPNRTLDRALANEHALSTINY
jgi:hypothetical protein